MARERVYLQKVNQAGRWLRLSIVMASVIVAIACAPAYPSAGVKVPAEEPEALPNLDGKRAPGASVGDKAHRYYYDARRMAVHEEWEEAIKFYDLAIASEPSYDAAYEGRAVAYQAVGRHQEAVEDYDRALVARESPLLYMERGHALVELGNYAQADRDFHQVQVIEPSYPGTYLGMGDVHRLMGDLEEAVRAYTQASAMDPESWRVYYFRGVCYFRLQEFQRASEDFERVITLQPHNAGAYFARGVIRWLGGECVPALEDFRGFVNLSKDGKAVSRAQKYIESLASAAGCEPPPDIPALASMR